MLIRIIGILSTRIIFKINKRVKVNLNSLAHYERFRNLYYNFTTSPGPYQVLGHCLRYKPEKDLNFVVIFQTRDLISHIERLQLSL